MRRRYAFEAEGISEEVKSQLEKVEDVVEDKCTTEEACDKMLEKIGDEKEKFDNALQTMADAAKDCKDGKCDKAEMAEKITPKMAELKEVAKSIGVASEGEALTEAELKDARDYLNGVEEIVEAKKDEVCDGSCEKSEGEEPESDDEDEETDDEAIEAYLDELDTAIESFAIDAAMEGANMDALGALKTAMGKMRTARKEMKAAEKSGDFKAAAEKAREGAGYADELVSACSNIPDSAASAAIVNIAVSLMVLLTGIAVGGAVGKARGAHFSKKIMAITKENARNAARDAHKAARSGIAAFSTASEKAKAAGSAVRKAGEEAAAKQASMRLKGGLVKGAMAGAAAGTATSAVSLAKVLKSKKLVNEDGDVNTENAKSMSANDVNALISAIKLAGKAAKNNFMKAAEKYDQAANAPAEGEGASESFAEDIFSGFISACESYRFDSNHATESDAPYLFD